jgi:hypothetical protein
MLALEYRVGLRDQSWKLICVSKKVLPLKDKALSDLSYLTESLRWVEDSGEWFLMWGKDAIASITKVEVLE